MAIAFNAASTGETGSGPSLTVSHACSGSDRVLVVTVSTWTTTDPAPTPTATYNGVSMTQITTHAFPFTLVDSFARITMFRLVAPATGANDIVISSATAEIVLSAASYTGVDQTTPFDTPSATDINQPTSTISQVISSETGDMVIDGIIGFDMGTVSAGAGQTQRAANNNGGTVNSTFMSEEAGAASVTMSDSWTNAIEDVGQIAVNMNAAAGGPIKRYSLPLLGVG
jgi:hypothetical protein